MRGKTKRTIALSLLTAMIVTSAVPSVAFAEELQISDEAKQEITTSVEEATNELLDNATEVTNEVTENVGEVVENVTTEPAEEVAEKEVAVTDSVEQLNEVVPNEELVSSTSTSLIINSNDMTFSDETIVSVVKYDEYYVVTYDTAENAKIAFDTFTSQGIAVEYNNSIDKPEDTSEEELDKVENTSDEVESTEADTTKKTITVAVLDTGIADVSDDELLKDMVLEGYSVIDDSVYDNNGHGTVMANIIASSFKDTEMYSDTEIKILPIKVLDENGNGSVLSVYMGMEYALSHNADVINLSISGLGNSNILTNEINKAYNQGVTTVVAAGNNSDDVANYIPGNIDTAITVSAVAERDNEKVFAEYSNHGSFVDFSAMGTYEMTYTDEAGEEIVTSVNGTSVASAYVTSYVAMLKALGREDVSETDVYASLQASVEDLGEVGYDEYFGFGYLEKENIKEIKEHTADNEKDVDLEENEDDGEQEVNASAWFYSGGLYLCNETGWGDLSGNWNHAPNATRAMENLFVAMDIFNVTNVTVYIGTTPFWFNNDIRILRVPDYKTVTITSVNPFVDRNSQLDQNGWVIPRSPWYRYCDNGGATGMLVTGYHANLKTEGIDFFDNAQTRYNYSGGAGCAGSGINNDYKYNYNGLKEIGGRYDAYGCSYRSTHSWWCTSTIGGTLDHCNFYSDDTGTNGSEGALVLFGGTVKNSNFYGTGNAHSRAVTCGSWYDDWDGQRKPLGHCYIQNCYIQGYGTLNPAIEAGPYTDMTVENTRIVGATNSNINNLECSLIGVNSNGTATLNNVTLENCYRGVHTEYRDNANPNIVIKNSEIKNCTYGIEDQGGNITIYNTANIHDCSDKGIFNESGTVTIDRNAAINIYKNQTGIWNQATCNILGGSYWTGSDTIGGIRSNTGQGIVNYGTLNLNPVPSQNKRVDIAQNGYNGIYNEGVVNDNGAYIWSNNHAGVVNGADGKTNPTYIKTSGNFDNNGYEGLANRGNATVINSNIYNNGSNGVANHKTATISNSTIYNNGIKSGWAVAGVCNGGNIILTNDTIRNNRFINAWNNVGTMTINGGSNFNNGSEQTTNFGVWNNDTLNINSGSFYGFTTDRGTDGASCLWNCKTANVRGGNFNNSHYGLVNWSTLNQSGGNSNRNSVYDVYQGGNYNVSPVSATITINKVFVCPNKVINFTNGADGTKLLGNMNLYLDTNDRVVGRQVVTGLANEKYKASRKEPSSPSIFNKIYVVSTTNKDNIGLEANTNSALITNATATFTSSYNKIMEYRNNPNVAIITANYGLYHKVNTPAGYEAKVYVNGKEQDYQEYFWNENHSFNQSEVDVKFFKQGKEDDSMVLFGWRDKNGVIYNPDGSVNKSLSTGDKNNARYEELTAILIPSRIAVKYTPNGANGKDVIDKNIVTTKTNGKVVTSGSYTTLSADKLGYIHDEKVTDIVDHFGKVEKLTYKSVGFDRDITKNYKNLDFKENTDYENFIVRIWLKENGDLSEYAKESYFDESVNAYVVTLNTIWDEAPTVATDTVIVPQENIDTVTEQYLIDQAITSLTDDNDEFKTGIEDGTIKVHIEDFDLDEIKNTGNVGAVSEVLVATDCVGNETRSMFLLVKTSTSETGGRRFTRKINEENYNKRDTSLPDGGESLGAMAVNSEWYLDENKANEIKEAFFNLKNDRYIYKWHFDIDGMRASKEYMKKYKNCPNLVWDEEVSHFDYSYISEHYKESYLYQYRNAMEATGHVKVLDKNY